LAPTSSTGSTPTRCAPPANTSPSIPSTTNAVDTTRRDGAYYEENLRLALASGRKIMAIETWNELDEGTGILETREFGRQYIELTRRYANLFKGNATAAGN
jgi:hypothetical protein